MYFAIKQRENNQQLIEEIRRHFSYVGDIYKGKPSSYYRVTRINELKRIIEHFDKYPLQSEKKQEVYNIWRQMVIHKLENYRKIDYNKLNSLAERLTFLNSPTPNLKEHRK